MYSMLVDISQLCFVARVSLKHAGNMQYVITYSIDLSCGKDKTETCKIYTPCHYIYQRYIFKQRYHFNTQ